MDQRILGNDVRNDSNYGSINASESANEDNGLIDKNDTENKLSNRLNILGFFCGVLSSLMAATGNGCAQVSFYENKRLFPILVLDLAELDELD